jgi:hypothetical protein
MQFYLPTKGMTVDRNGKEQQAFLTQVLLPKISNSKDKNKIYKFFKEAHKKSIDENFKDNEKVVCFNPAYGCDFETELRFASVEDRADHIKLMQKLRPEQKAVLSPYIRLFLAPNPNKTKLDLKQAVPLAFGKGFDSDYFLGNRENPSSSGIGDRLTSELQSPFGVANDAKSFSRGEAAYIKNMAVERLYNNTGIFDPINIQMSFFFSSFDVFANKPAIEKSSASATFLNRVSRSGSLLGGFSTLNDLRYTELITFQTERGFRLILEYGWKVDDSVSESIFSFAEKQIINKFEKSYYLLEPTKHNFTFDEDGGLSMTVDYVPSIIDNLHKSTNLRTGIFYSPDIFLKIQGTVSEDAKKTLSKIQKLEKKEVTTTNEAIKKRSEIAKEKSKLSNSLNFNFATLFKKYFEKSNLIYTAEIASEIIKDPARNTDTPSKLDKTSFNLKISRKDIEQPVEIKETFTFEQIRKQIIDVQKASSDKKAIRFLGLGPSGEDNVEDLDIEEAYGRIFKDLFRATDVAKTDDVKESTKIRFVLLKDVVAVLLRMADAVDPNNSSPYTIMSNFAMPMPDGKKFWCNTGDIPLELRLFTNIVNTFFNQRPNASLNNLLSFLFQDVFPVLLVQESKRYTLPSLSYPFYNFKRDKWRSDTGAKKRYKDLIDGKMSALKSFAAGYFDDASYEASAGCIFIGQTPRISYDNTKINLGRNIEVASEALFKDDKKLTKLGIGKLIVGNSVGVVRRLNFSAQGDEYTQNFNYELNKLKPGVDNVLLSSTYQYNLTATLYGNNVYQFSTILYVPAASLGYSPLTARQALNRGGFDDFEMGGLYTIMRMTDQIDFANNSYTTTIQALSTSRESDIVKKSYDEHNKSPDKAILNPTFSPKVSFPEYIYQNSEVIDRAYRVQIDNLAFEADILEEALQGQFEEDILNEALQDFDREEQAEQRISNLNRATGVQPVPEVSGLNTEAFSKPFGSSASNLNTGLSLGGDE